MPQKIKFSDVKPGMVLVVTSDFGCLSKGTTGAVKLTEPLRQGAVPYLYVECTEGKHLLDAWIGEDGFLLGFELADDQST